MKDSVRTELPLFGNDRPPDLADGKRGRDCLVELLFDLTTVELNRLPRMEALHDWFRTAGMVLDLLPTENARQTWTELLAQRIVQQFPKFVGGLATCRLQIGCMRNQGRFWWDAWRREHAPVPPTRLAGAGTPASPVVPAPKVNITQESGPSESEP